MNNLVVFTGRLCSITLCFVLAAFLCITALAQTGTTTASGSITDSKGAVVAGATVRLMNAQKGFTRTAVSSTNGSYSFTSVPPDTYRIEIELKGFKKTVLSNIAALVDKPTDADATLEVGNVNEVVNVSG